MSLIGGIKGVVQWGFGAKPKNVKATQFAPGLDASWLIKVAKSTKVSGDKTAASSESEYYITTDYTHAQGGMQFILESVYHRLHAEDGGGLAVTNEVIVNGNPKEIAKVVDSYISHHNLMPEYVIFNKKSGEVRLMETMVDETTGEADAATAAMRLADFLNFFGVAADSSWVKGETQVEKID